MDLSDKRLVLTRQGYDEFKRELEELLSVKRPAIVNRIREARQLGDLSENFDYHDAKQTQGLMEARIRELEAILNQATVVETSEKNGHITVGSKVIVKDEDGFEDEYLIVGPAESSPADGRISYESAVGSALMDHKVGEIVTVRTPGGEIKCEIVSVE